MLEELARLGCYRICERETRQPMVRLKGQPKPAIEFEGFFGPLDAFHAWDGPSVKRLVRTGPNSPYRKAWQWFGNQGEELCKAFISQRYTGDLKAAMRATGSFENFFYEFRAYFGERKAVYMAEVDKQLTAAGGKLAKTGKTPLSHGGVANLLKVLTKTMTQQGSSIQTIAKVQYTVCMQAGIYLPEEFITDVLVAANIIEEGKEAMAHE